MAYPQQYRYESEIRFNCPTCGALINEVINVPETNWSGDNSDERFVQDEGEVTCNECGTHYHLYIQNSDGNIFVAVDDHENTNVKCSNAEITGGWEDYFDDLDLPPDPASVLRQTLADVREVLKNSTPHFYTDTLNRMAFIQQFAALEA